jgi:hypothetical protein
MSKLVAPSAFVSGMSRNRLDEAPNQSVCVSTEGDTPMAKKIDPLERALVDLDKLKVGELVEKYRDLFGKDTRTRNRPYLVRKIGWRIQERAKGGLSERAKARLAELAESAPLRQVAPRPAKRKEEVAPNDGRDPRLPKPGTVLRREYDGKEYAVTVHEADFEYRGKRYGSLSKIAKEITGTHWNGWLFFNLTTRKRGGEAA